MSWFTQAKIFFSEVKATIEAEKYEEAARLIQFEAAYNANAQVIRVAQELFDTLLASF